MALLVTSTASDLLPESSHGLSFSLSVRFRSATPRTLQDPVPGSHTPGAVCDPPTGALSMSPFGLGESCLVDCCCISVLLVALRHNSLGRGSLPFTSSSFFPPVLLSDREFSIVFVSNSSKLIELHFYLV